MYFCHNEKRKEKKAGREENRVIEELEAGDSAYSGAATWILETGFLSLPLL